MKAGLSQEAWKGTNAKIYKFQAKIFNEKKV
jgi:AMMECR1 domain-containing protein